MSCREHVFALSGPAALSPCEGTPSAHGAARRVPAHRGPGRWLRGRSALTHHRGSRLGAGSRSVADSRTKPTVDPSAGRDVVRSNGVAGPVQPSLLEQRSCHRDDPVHIASDRHSQQASRSSGDVHADPRATAQLWPCSPASRSSSRHSDEARERSLTEIGRGRGRSRALRSREHTRERSLPFRRTRGSASTGARATGVPSRHSRETIVSRQRETRRPPLLLVRSTTPRRFHSRTAVDARVGRPMVGRVTAWVGVVRDPMLASFVPPSRILIVEVLRRLLEPKLHASIAVMDQLLEITPRMERLLQRIQRQVAAQRARHPPADDLPREHVRDEGDVHKARPRHDVGQSATQS